MNNDAKKVIATTSLSLIPMVVMVSLAILFNGCDFKQPNTSRDPKTVENSGYELQYWSTVKYDEHLYTCRRGVDSQAIVHSPNCPCLKENK